MTLNIPQRRRNDPRPFQVGDEVDVIVAKGWNPTGGRMLAVIEADVSSQYGSGVFLVRYLEPDARDIVHQQRFELTLAIEDQK